MSDADGGVPDGFEQAADDPTRGIRQYQWRGDG
jgi:hypothetical protein